MRDAFTDAALRREPSNFHRPESREFFFNEANSGHDSRPMIC